MRVASARQLVHHSFPGFLPGGAREKMKDDANASALGRSIRNRGKTRSRVRSPTECFAKMDDTRNPRTFTVEELTESGRLGGGLNGLPG